METYHVLYESIKRETEKAICLTCKVYWGMSSHYKDIWFPKSQIDEMDKAQKVVHVACWFVDEMEGQNNSHGYDMKITKRLKFTK